MIKVSIIIPVYNGEQYLEQCIRSVLAQTLKELEIICVDDGSKDGSARIIKRFKEEDKRIILLQQQNQGPGKARNLGLKRAQGEYAAFLDADDFYIDSDALEKMFILCKTGRVHACAGLRRIVKNGTLTKDPLFQRAEKAVVLDYRDFQIDYNYQDFIFSRKHLIENNICFPDYRRFQDPPFLVKALFAVQKFAVADTYLYGYRLPDISARFNHKNTCDLLHGLIDNLMFARVHNLDILFRNTLQRLELEYKHIFYRNMFPDGFDILKLLLKANRIAASQKGDADYIIKPLQGLLKDMGQYGRRILEEIEKEKEIALYGAGQAGQVFFQYLKNNYASDKVVAFVVSEQKGNRHQIEGVPVIPLQDLKKEIPIFVTARENVQGEIAAYLNENQYRSFRLVDDDFLCMILDDGSLVDLEI